MLKKIIIGCDHGGYKIKNVVVNYLTQSCFELEDVGTYSDERCDYPGYAHRVALKVKSEKNCMGILICTTGQGMVITANRYPGVRAALCWNKEITNLARAHNDANILCLPANYVTENDVEEILNSFMESRFEGKRHLKRVELI